MAHLVRDQERADVAGRAARLPAANAIETAQDDASPDDDHVQQTVEMLAAYWPEGGEYLFETAATRQHLTETLSYLRQQ